MLHEQVSGRTRRPLKKELSNYELSAFHYDKIVALLGQKAVIASRKFLKTSSSSYNET